jgi:hypothetical protein
MSFQHRFSFALRWFASILLAIPAAAVAQIDVAIDFSRPFWLQYEAMPAKIAITNNTGRDLVLSSRPGRPWFGFQILHDGGRMVVPRDPNYTLGPITIRAGETLRRTFDLFELFPITAFGAYKISAYVYWNETDKNYLSRPTQIEVSTGREIWSQTVGAPFAKPGEGTTRKYSLLQFQTPEMLTLYVRLEGEDDGLVYCTWPLGRTIGGAVPSAELDNENTLHVLHMTGSKVFSLSKVAIDGTWLGKSVYRASDRRVGLRRLTSGGVGVVGAREEEPEGQTRIPRLSDRPPGLPATTPRR